MPQRGKGYISGLGGESGYLEKSLDDVNLLLEGSEPASPSPAELSLPGLGPVLPQGSAKKDHLLERNMDAGQAKKQRQPPRTGDECAVQCVALCLFSADGEIFTQSPCLPPPSTFCSPHPVILLLPYELGVPFLPSL